MPRKVKDKTTIETEKHIKMVGQIINKIKAQLTERAKNHDASKLVEPEFSTFVEYTPKLKGSTYGSDEYNKFLKEMKPALDHHYECNSHHPEHFKYGIEDMNIVDLVEMLCDWKAATLRHDDGDIRKSITLNTKRFNINNQLSKILMNSVDLLE